MIHLLDKPNGTSGPFSPRRCVKMHTQALARPIPRPFSASCDRRRPPGLCSRPAGLARPLPHIDACNGNTDLMQCRRLQLQ